MCARACNADYYSSHTWSDAIVWDATAPSLLEVWMYEGRDFARAVLEPDLRQGAVDGRDWRHGGGHAAVLHHLPQLFNELRFEVRVHDTPIDAATPIKSALWAALPGWVSAEAQPDGAEVAALFNSTVGSDAWLNASGHCSFTTRTARPTTRRRATA